MTLGEELEMVEKYLEIEKARFAERLQVRVEVAEELRDARSAEFDSAAGGGKRGEHGIAKRVQGGTIGISAARANGTLELCVKNDGPEFPVGWEKERRGIRFGKCAGEVGVVCMGVVALRVEHGAECAMSFRFAAV